ncbi:hypothetical protein [Candidatus Symbiobacter mobilis]|nr:hypothetical protein [Candidatus Symbiobacter mobilis]
MTSNSGERDRRDSGNVTADSGERDRVVGVARFEFMPSCFLG